MTEVKLRKTIYNGSFREFKKRIDELGYSVAFIGQPETLRDLPHTGGTGFASVAYLCDDAIETINQYLTNNDADAGYVYELQRLRDHLGSSAEVDVVIAPIKLKKNSSP